MESGIDPQYSENGFVPGDDYVPHLAIMLWQTKKRIQGHIGRQEQDITIDDIGSVMHQEHIGVQSFRYGVTAAHKFHGVDVLPREYPPNSNTYGDGDDHRHDDVIITRHLK